jgi:hypothetical protein
MDEKSCNPSCRWMKNHVTLLSIVEKLISDVLSA